MYPTQSKSQLQSASLRNRAMKMMMAPTLTMIMTLTMTMMMAMTITMMITRTVMSVAISAQVSSFKFSNAMGNPCILAIFVSYIDVILCTQVSSMSRNIGAAWAQIAEWISANAAGQKLGFVF